MTEMLAIACAVLVAMTVWGEVLHRTMVRMVAKPLASACFIGVGWELGLAETAPAVMVALVLSAIGDVALLSSERKWFLSGLVSFLLAHVAYVVAFVQLGVASWGLMAAAPVMIVFGAVVWRWLGPHTGKLKRPVIAYVVVICAMACVSAGVAGLGGQARMLVCLGALVFVASDLCVARQRFVDPGPWNRILGLPLYYGAQLMITWAVAGVVAS
jgi:uncharacterized membrane protein YhhN